MPPSLFNTPTAKPTRKTLRKSQNVYEGVLWRYLKNRQLNGYKFCRQYSIGVYVLDFYCSKKRLAIELDGKQHAEEESVEHDSKRTNFLNEQGIKVIRFWNLELINNTDDVINRISKALLEP